MTPREQVLILCRMQRTTARDYKKTKIMSRKIRLAEEIISREKRINKLIQQIKWD